MVSLTKANSQFIVNDTPIKDMVSLHKYAKIVNVGQQNFTISQILANKSLPYKSLLKENTDLGFTNDNYWIKFQIYNTTNNDIFPFIETSRPIVDVAELYVIQNNMIKLYKSGDLIPFKDRALNNRKTLFRTALNSKTMTTFYLHLKSDGETINVPIYMKTAEKELQLVSFEQIVFGFFYGILFITGIIYIFFFFGLKEKSFLYYSLYVLFIGLLQFSVDGYFYQYFTPNSGWLSSHCVLFFATLANFFLGRYSQQFLKIKEYSILLYRLFYGLYVLDFLSLLSLIFISDHQYLYPIANVLGLILLLLIITSVIVVYYKTKSVDRFFAVGVLFLITGFVVFILKNFGVLPSVFWTENGSKLGTGLEVIFLSLSMANLIKKIKEERELLQGIALKRSEEMNEMKSYFLSNISHELRTPLNTIMNFIDSINGETDSNSIQEKCKVIKDSSKSLLSSVNDIFDYSKIEKNEIKLEPTIFNAHQLLDEIKSNISIRAKNKGINFEFIEANSIPKMLFGDENRIRQIIMNLLSNSLKFTNDGVVEFKIESQIVNNKVSLTLTISDTGDGIEKEKMDSIFDSFSQQSINNKRKYGGLGLGLYIVKALVNLHKGSIDMGSIINKGTICTVKIEVDNVFIKETEIPIDKPIYDLKGKRILVVEDNVMNQMVLKMIMKKWLNTEADYAINGEEGLEMMKNTKYDVILMDLQMPIMDGYEATIEIRNGNSGMNDKNIPIIAVTADVMESTKVRVKEIGMNFYMSKPIDKDMLFATIEKVTA